MREEERQIKRYMTRTSGFLGRMKQYNCRGDVLDGGSDVDIAMEGALKISCDVKELLTVVVLIFGWQCGDRWIGVELNCGCFYVTAIRLAIRLESWDQRPRRWLSYTTVSVDW